jgi:hypothetical protein
VLIPRRAFRALSAVAVTLATVASTVACGSGGVVSPTVAASTPSSGTSTRASVESSAQAGAPSTPSGSAQASVAATVGSTKASAKPSGSAKAGATPGSALGQAGWSGGRAAVPAGAAAVGTTPTRWVGSGTAASCTSSAVGQAVAQGGVIGFRCGSAPVTITMTATAKVRNTSPLVVLDGGGLVTLSGGGKRRILYLNTCDAALVWTTTHCQNQQTPQLVVQNLTFADGNATGQHEEGGGGGAILVRGGQFRVVNSRFVRNRCDGTGPDLGGAAIRVLSQWQNQPVYVVRSTFGGAPGQGGVCSNGGALSSIGVSWTILNSLFSYNSAIGDGANPAQAGTPGGGSGGAIYNDGNTMTLRVEGSQITNNSAREGGGAVFFVSNDRTGSLQIASSTLRSNPNPGFQTAGYPGIFFLGKGTPSVTGSTLK